MIEALPAAAEQGQTLQVEIYGAEFLPGATLTISGDGITISSMEVQRGSLIVATISVAADAAPGPRDITVTNVDGGSGTKTAAFTVSGETEEKVTITDLDDSDPAVEYRGWHLKEDASASNAGYHARTGGSNGGHHARVVFTGHQITYFFGTSQRGGTADVYLDGALAQSVSFHGSTKHPAFGSSVTFSGLSDSTHELRILHRSGESYVDGFRIVAGGGDAEAVDTRSQTSTSDHSITGSTILLQTVDVRPGDELISVVVDGAAQPLTVNMLNALGSIVATGSSLLEGSTTTGLDATLAAGTYTLQVVGSPTLEPSEVTVIVARTVRVK